MRGLIVLFASFCLIGCVPSASTHVADSAANPGPNRPASTSPPERSASPLLVQALDDSFLIRTANQRGYFGLAEAVRQAANIRTSRQLLEAANTFAPNAERCVVLKCLSLRGGSRDWELRFQPNPIEVDKALTESGSSVLDVSTVVLFEDRNGLGYIANCAPPEPFPETTDSRYENLNASLSGVVCGHWLPPESRDQPGEPYTWEVDDGRKQLRNAMEKVQGVKLLHADGDSWDGSEAVILTVLDGERRAVMAGINVGSLIDEPPDAIGRHERGIIDSWLAIERGMRSDRR